MENSGTRNISGATSGDQCVTKPGYGYQDGEVCGGCHTPPGLLIWFRGLGCCCRFQHTLLDSSMHPLCTSEVCQWQLEAPPATTHQCAARKQGPGASMLLESRPTAPHALFGSQVVLCEVGTWASGGDQSDCVSCGGDGWSTLANASASTGEPASGATSAAQCAADVGYELQTPGVSSSGLKPCVQGFYKALVGSSRCQACPAGRVVRHCIRALDHRADIVRH